jgi:hypothetical protein
MRNKPCAKEKFRKEIEKENFFESKSEASAMVTYAQLKIHLTLFKQFTAQKVF